MPDGQTSHVKAVGDIADLLRMSLSKVLGSTPYQDDRPRGLCLTQQDTAMITRHYALRKVKTAKTRQEHRLTTRFSMSHDIETKGQEAAYVSVFATMWRRNRWILEKTAVQAIRTARHFLPIGNTAGAWAEN